MMTSSLQWKEKVTLSDLLHFPAWPTNRRAAGEEPSPVILLPLNSNTAKL